MPPKTLALAAMLALGCRSTAARPAPPALPTPRPAPAAPAPALVAEPDACPLRARGVLPDSPRYTSAELVGGRAVVVGFAGPKGEQLEVVPYEVPAGARLPPLYRGTGADDDFGRGAVVFAGRLLVGVSGPALRAFDVTTGREAWQAPAPAEAARATRAWQEGETTVVRLTTASRDLLAAFSPTGALKWQRPLAPDEASVEVAGRVYVASPRGVGSFDANTGAELWRSPPRADADEPAERLLADAQRVVLFDLTRARVRTLDAATGAPRATFELPALASTAALKLAGGRLFALTADSRLVAVDVDGAAVRWSWRLVSASWPAYEAELVASGPLVGACSGDGAIRIFDAETGAPRLQHGTTECRGFRFGLVDGRVVVLTRADDTRMQWLAEDAAEGPAPSVPVEGTLRVDCQKRAGATVHVGNAAATTDAAGRFAARVRACGVVPVLATTVEKPRGAPVPTFARAVVEAAEAPRPLELSVSTGLFCYGCVPIPKCEP